MTSTVPWFFLPLSSACEGSSLNAGGGFLCGGDEGVFKGASAVVFLVLGRCVTLVAGEMSLGVGEAALPIRVLVLMEGCLEPPIEEGEGELGRDWATPP